jgi:hypothetical protein
VIRLERVVRRPADLVGPGGFVIPCERTDRHVDNYFSSHHGEPMGRELYDFLADSLLFNEALLSDSYASVPQPEWEREIARYFEHMVQSARAIATDVISGTDAVRLSVLLSQFSPLPTIASLKRYLLYYNRVLVPAPHLFLERQGAAQKARLMKEVTPLVAAGLLVFVPLGEWPGEDREREEIGEWRDSFVERLRETVGAWLKDAVPHATTDRLAAATAATTDLITFDVLHDLPRARLSQSILELPLSFADKLLSRQLSPRATSEVDIAQLALRLELPCVEFASLNDLALIRTECSDAFANFQTDLRRRLTELRGIDDPTQLPCPVWRTN